MKEFQFSSPTKVYFGTDIVQKAFQSEKNYLYGNIMIVTTGNSLIRLGYLETIVELLRKMENVKNVVVFDKISRNPKLEEVVVAIQCGQKEAINTVIGFGGGSAIDAAKAVAVGIPYAVGRQESCMDIMEDYLLNGKEPGEDTLPIVAIPTTAGTGSELSKAAIITSERHQVKTGIRGSVLLPRIAIVDAKFTWTIPMDITMETGFDVIAHAIESHMAVKANRYSEMLSEKALCLAGDGLRKLRQDLNDKEAREDMCFASMIMGSNLAHVGTCLPHRIQYPVGIATETSHGAGLAALYPAWISHEYEVCSEKVNFIFECLGLDIAKTGEEAGIRFRNFQRELGIAYTLATLGVHEDEAQNLADKVTGNLLNDRLAEKENIILQIIRDSI